MVEQHRKRGSERGPVSFGILTVSDTKTSDDDASGAEIARLIEGSGNRVARQEIVRDDDGSIRAAVASMLMDVSVEAVVTTGGTGVTSRDVTPEALAPLVEKRLDSFAHLFAAASARDVGSAALLSRAFAFTARRKPVFCLPGSPRAVATAMGEVVLPEIAHVVAELHR